LPAAEKIAQPIRQTRTLSEPVHSTVVEQPSPEKHRVIETTVGQESAETSDITRQPALAGQADSSLQHDELLQRLYQALLQQRSYPGKARRRGWQGKTLLGFVLLPNGRFTSVEVLQGSGHAVLDEAALRSLAAIQPFEAVEIHQPLQLQIALSYQLD
jgi:protein TonB